MSNKLNPTDLIKREELTDKRETLEVIELDLTKKQKELNKIWRNWRKSIKKRYKLTNDDVVNDMGEIERAQG